MATRLYSTAAWMVGATSLATMMAPGAARAVVICTDPYTSAGSSSLSDPTVIPDGCHPTEITGDQAFPAYWEFAWDGSGNSVISSSVTQGVPGEFGSYTGGSFYGDLALYTAGGSLIQAANFATTSYAGSFTGETDATLGDVLDGLSPGHYIVGIEPPVSSEQPDPPFTITFSAASVPEPASLGLFGGALAALGFLRKRRKAAR